MKLFVLFIFDANSYSVKFKNSFMFSKEASMRVMLCDDEKIFLTYMKEQLTKDSFDKNEDILITEFTCGEDLLKAWQEGAAADILFLDIQMQGIDGMETARKLRQMGCDSLIVFLTGLDDYMQEGYEVRAFRYLIKNQIETTLGHVMEACRQELLTGRYFSFVCGHENFRIPISDILYFESDRRRILLHTRLDVYQFYGKMDDLEEQIGNCGFLRCHRSYLVQERYVLGWKGRELWLRNQTQTRIPISRSCEKEVNRRLLLRIGGALG